VADATRHGCVKVCAAAFAAALHAAPTIFGQGPQRFPVVNCLCGATGTDIGPAPLVAAGSVAIQCSRIHPPAVQCRRIHPHETRAKAPHGAGSRAGCAAAAHCSTCCCAWNVRITRMVSQSRKRSCMLRGRVHAGVGRRRRARGLVLQACPQSAACAGSSRRDSLPGGGSALVLRSLRRSYRGVGEAAASPAEPFSVSSGAPPSDADRLGVRDGKGPVRGGSGRATPRHGAPAVGAESGEGPVGGGRRRAAPSKRSEGVSVRRPERRRAPSGGRARRWGRLLRRRALPRAGPRPDGRRRAPACAGPSRGR